MLADTTFVVLLHKDGFSSCYTGIEIAAALLAVCGVLVDDSITAFTDTGELLAFMFLVRTLIDKNIQSQGFVSRFFVLGEIFNG